MPSVYCPVLRQYRSGDLVRLEGSEFHHLAHVTRRRILEPVLLNSGDGLLCWAEYESSGSDHALLRLTRAELDQAKPLHAYAIAFALLKNRHDELLVEKCTELGATDFFPLFTEHSVRQPGPGTLARFAKIALAAVKQCDNPWLPRIHAPLTLEHALTTLRERGFQPIVCSENKPQRWLHDLRPEQTGQPCFLIGPEGGWSKAEQALLQKEPEITLARLITRAETAAIAVAAQWLAQAERGFEAD